MSFGDKVVEYIHEKIKSIEKKYTKNYIRTPNDLGEYDTYIYINKLMADNPNINYQDYFLFVFNAINNSKRNKAVSTEYNEWIYWYVSECLLTQILEDTRQYIGG